jgi:hypothetical protein
MPSPKSFLESRMRDSLQGVLSCPRKAALCTGPKSFYKTIIQYLDIDKFYDVMYINLSY